MRIDLGPYEPDKILEIPETGNLPTIPEDISAEYIPLNRIYGPDLPMKHKVKNQHPDADPSVLETIEFGLKHEEPYIHDAMRHSTSYYMVLVWVPPRKEWVAFHRRCWGGTDLSIYSEDGLTPWAGQPDLPDRGGSSHTYRGPYALDDYCKTIVDKLSNSES